MRLNTINICHYLLDKGFITFSSVVDGDFAVFQQQARNLCFFIPRVRAGGLFVKQLVEVNPTNIYLLQKEATCYWLFHNQQEFAAMREYVPHYYGYDVLSQVLVVGFMDGSDNIHDLLLAGAGEVEEYGRCMGQILARLHLPILDRIPHESALQFFSKITPWAFLFASMNASQAFPSGAQQQIMNLIQQDQNLCAAIARAQALWQPTCLIHGDIKLANFIATRPVEEGAKLEMKLIDWEIADIGDPCWDIAGAFQAFLAPWVLSFEASPTQNPKRLPELKVFEIQNTRKAIRSFWEAYVGEKGWTSSDAAPVLQKSVVFMAIRLLQTSIESALFAAQMPPASVRLVQMASHILQNPEMAIQTLLQLQNNGEQEVRA